MVKVLLVNGSPHKEGCTYTALAEAAKTFQEEGIEAEIYWLGNKPIAGCRACNSCAKDGRCVIDDKVNEFLDMADSCDGFLFGTPVHWASASGTLTSFMDRIFYADFCNKSDKFYLKPAAAVVSARRSGTTATYDQVSRYFTMTQMPIVSSQYWNNVHGSQPSDVREDLEGLQTMRTLARNMAFFLKCKEAGLKNGVALPKREETIFTGFLGRNPYK